MKAAMRREPTERIPTMPQICYDLPIRIEATESGSDWREGYRRCAENPELVFEYVIALAERVQCDGLRLFPPEVPRKAILDGDSLVVIEPETGDRLGVLDLHGGGAFLPDKAIAPIESLNDAKERIDEVVESLNDEKLELLHSYRKRVPDYFVASTPPAITFDLYNQLRGREQAMVDLYDRPEFLRAVLDLQAEAAIKGGEKLLTTDIDAFYIGDASASASLISPKHFEQFCVPAYQKFCRHFRNEDILIYIHVCGNSKPILEMMADTGAHVIEPLDPLGGVEVADAKERVGNRVALMGGVNTLTLANGTVEEVRAESINKCREGGPYGYVLAAGDMVPSNTPFENLKAMVDVARDSLWKESIS